jgi:hypothetical protein
VQEVEEVREAHKAAAKCTNGSNCGNAKLEEKRTAYYYWEGALASKKDIYLLPDSNQGACKCANIISH